MRATHRLCRCLHGRLCRPQAPGAAGGSHQPGGARSGALVQRLGRHAESARRARGLHETRLDGGPPYRPPPPLPHPLPAACRLWLALQVVVAAAKPLRVMIAGAPAAGKGTQCAKIVEKVGAAWWRGAVGHLLGGLLVRGLAVPTSR